MCVCVWYGTQARTRKLGKVSVSWRRESGERQGLEWTSGHSWTTWHVPCLGSRGRPPLEAASTLGDPGSGLPGVPDGAPGHGKREAQAAPRAFGRVAWAGSGFRESLPRHENRPFGGGQRGEVHRLEQGPAGGLEQQLFP